MHMFVYVFSFQVIVNKVTLGMSFCVSLGLTQNVHIKGNKEEARIGFEKHQAVTQVISQMREKKKVGKKYLIFFINSKGSSANASGIS